MAQAVYILLRLSAQRVLVGGICYSFLQAMAAAGNEKPLVGTENVSKLTDIAPKPKFKLTHKILDRAFVASLVLAALKSGNLKSFLAKVLEGLKMFPNHY